MIIAERILARIKANMGMRLSPQEEALLPNIFSTQVKEGAWAMKFLHSLGRWKPDTETGVSANVRSTEKEDSFGRPLS